MTDKFRKIDRQYVLSDSSVNEYGFRLLTSGYQLEAYQKNPIGYYMHRREDGIVLKWDELHIEDDKVMGTPVINLANERGAQTCEEAENGFLNAASVGHIVVLEYSTDADMMLPGQTGPTITKWYNKECSLVDIPGNSNSLTKLYDAQENEINLLDINRPLPLIVPLSTNTVKDMCAALQLTGEPNELLLIAGVKSLAGKASDLTQENKLLHDDKLALQQQVDDINNARNRYEINGLLTRALEDKKITTELRNKLAHDYTGNPEGLKSLISAMPAYRSIAEQLKSRQGESETEVWEWADYEQKDPKGKKLEQLRANDPEKYKAIFEKKFSVRYGH